MKLIIAISLIFASAMSFAATSSKQCDTFLSTDEVSSPLTIDEIEKQAIAEILAWRKDRPEIPNQPFGYAYAGWLRFKSMLQPGDEIVRYDTSKLSWQTRSGHRGFALVRSGCIINRFITTLS